MFRTPEGYQHVYLMCTIALITSLQVSNKQVSADEDSSSTQEPDPAQGSTHKDEDYEQESGQASVYVYKRANENAADILQPLISQDPRQFRWAFIGSRSLDCDMS